MISRLAIVAWFVPIVLLGSGCTPSTPLVDGKGSSARSQTQLGRVLELPEGLSHAGTHGFPTYSPDGARLAFPLLGGDVGILNRSDGTALSVRRDLLGGVSSMLHAPVWLGALELAVSESWEPEAAAQQNRATFPHVGLRQARRIVRLDGVPLSQEAESTWPGMATYLGRAPDGRAFLLDERGRAVHVLRPDGSTTTVYETPEPSMIVSSPASFPFLVLLRAAAQTPFGAPVSLEVVNLDTLQARTVAGFPRPWPRGVLVTPDGQWLLSATLDDANAWRPFRCRVSDGQRTPLAAAESWFPVALSTPADVLLVLLETMGDGGTDGDTRRWVELPLSTIVAAP